MAARQESFLPSRPIQGHIPPSDPDISLAEELAHFSHDPLGFVLFAYPWGEPGPLADRAGPNEWQRDALEHVRVKFEEAGGDPAHLPEIIGAVIRESIASGHGVGKSAFIVWLAQWGMATCVDCRGVVTANTENQLRTKTWPEMTKWYQMLICKHWFTLTATSLHSRDPEHEKTWRFDMIPWSDTNMEAFAGLHNLGKRIILIFDEASRIIDMIWETAEGALTDAGTEIIWVVCGNPTNNVGRFRETHEGQRHRWWTRQVDSRSVPFTNKEEIRRWEEDYGDDSDFFRVRVRGVFPRAGVQQFIPSDIVDEAMRRENARVSVLDPLVLGVDVARFGDDETVIAIRKGRDGRTHPPIKMRGADTMMVAQKVVDTANFFKADAVFIDGGGVGGGVVDRCRQLKLTVIEISFGGKPDRTAYDGAVEKYYNKGSEMWGYLRAAIKAGLTLPQDPALKMQLTQRTFEYRQIRQQEAILLTSKEAMKKEGLESPDIPDAYALTYAYPVQKTDQVAGYYAAKKETRVLPDYDPYNSEQETVQ